MASRIRGRPKPRPTPLETRKKAFAREVLRRRREDKDDGWWRRHVWLATTAAAFSGAAVISPILTPSTGCGATPSFVTLRRPLALASYLGVQQPINALLGLGYSLFLPECQGTQSRSGKQGQVGARGIDAHTPLGPLPFRQNVISAISASFRCHPSGPR